MATVSKRGKKHPLGSSSNVLSLTEAAAYLRVSPAAVLDAVSAQRLPGRLIAGEWRFLDSAIDDWLRRPDDPDFWATHLGALRDDPFLSSMLEDIYKQRGRPMLAID